jgi:hypothetical protein
MLDAASVCSSLQFGHFTVDLANGSAASVSPIAFTRTPHLQRQKKTAFIMSAGIIAECQLFTIRRNPMIKTK